VARSTRDGAWSTVATEDRHAQGERGYQSAVPLPDYLYEGEIEML
jgi:hypothetical protein